MIESDFIRISLEYQFAAKTYADLQPLKNQIDIALTKFAGDIKLLAQKKHVDNDLEICSRLCLKLGDLIWRSMEERYDFKMEFVVLTDETRAKAEKISGVALEKPGGLKLAT